MRMMLLVHVLGGGLGLLTGYIALYASKGAALHRKTGMVFVWAMLTMAITAVSPFTASRSFDRGAMAVALAIGLGCSALAVNAVVRGGSEGGLAFPLVLFGGVALAAAEGDRRALSTGELPMIAMSYWMWKLRTRRPDRRTVLANAHEPAMAKVSL